MYFSPKETEFHHRVLSDHPQARVRTETLYHKPTFLF